MKFGPVAPADALGATAVHSIRQSDLVLKKGTLIGPAEVAALKAAGVKEIVVARLEPGDVSEDQAAADIAAAVTGEGMRADRAFTGRCNLFAETAGVLVLDKETIDRLNRIDEAVTIATLPAFKPVVEGEMIATVKIIPFAVAAKARDQAVAEAAKAKPVIRVEPYKVRKIGIVSTLLPGLSPKVIEKMRPFLTQDGLNAIMSEVAGVALNDAESVKKAALRNRNDRQEFRNAAMIRMLMPIDSHANFIMVDTQHPADEVIEHFKKHNVLIGRHFPPMDTYIRVSLGTPPQMHTFWQTWDMLPWSKKFMHH